MWQMYKSIFCPKDKISNTIVIFYRIKFNYKTKLLNTADFNGFLLTLSILPYKFPSKRTEELLKRIKLGFRGLFKEISNRGVLARTSSLEIRQPSAIESIQNISTRFFLLFT